MVERNITLVLGLVSDIMFGMYVKCFNDVVLVCIVLVVLVNLAQQLICLMTKMSISFVRSL
jgi:hypothetical protein